MRVSMKALAVLGWSLNRATCRLISSTERSRFVTGATLAIHPPSSERNIADECSIGKACDSHRRFIRISRLESTRLDGSSPAWQSGEKLDGPPRTESCDCLFGSFA